MRANQANNVSTAVALTPEQIMAESFRIIDAEVGSHPFDAVEWQVVRRIIHASGDLEFAHLVHFQHAAAHAGVQALQAGMPIVTDVRMVASGIQRPVLEKLGITLHCFIDAPEVARMAQEQETTRSACAMCRTRLGKNSLPVVGAVPETMSRNVCSARFLSVMSSDSAIKKRGESSVPGTSDTLFLTQMSRPSFRRYRFSI